MIWAQRCPSGEAVAFLRTRAIIRNNRVASPEATEESRHRGMTQVPTTLPRHLVRAASWFARTELMCYTYIGQVLPTLSVRKPYIVRATTPPMAPVFHGSEHDERTVQEAQHGKMHSTNTRPSHSERQSELPCMRSWLQSLWRVHQWVQQ